jgi:predicted phosphodiesterase
LSKITPSIEQRIIELVKERKQLHNIDKSVSIYPWVVVTLMNETGIHMESEKLRDFCRRYRERNGLNENFEVKSDLQVKSQEKEFNLTEAVLKDLQKSIDKNVLLEKYKISERIFDATIEDLRDRGYIIENENNSFYVCKDIVPKDNIYNVDWNGDKIIRFGTVSDTHMNSKDQQLTHLNTLYDIFQKEGITDVYHAGDIDEGENMRQGHKYECFNQGADAHERYIIEKYPYREGIKTYFITGNHDHSMIKACGHDIGLVIAKERKDMIYLGMSNAKINLTPNCVLEVNHPLDGASYALSYTLQKTIDSMSGGEKPSILLNGHHHKAMYIFYRNVHAFECGTLQGQTAWMRGKRLPAHVGGWIIEVHVNDEGTITRCKGEFIPFYKMLKEDY